MTQLIHGDCLEEMPKLEENSVDSVVCDPPYGLKFMGKDWDHGVPGVPFWEAALRVAKPGAYLLAFGGTRMFHRLAVAIEDAGWEIRDTVMWVYGSGFPKSHNVSKAIDKAAGVKRRDLGPNPNKIGRTQDMRGGNFMTHIVVDDVSDHTRITAPATDEAKQWDGWGTALKPAWEPIIVARKPLIGTVAQNVLEYGTGAINIDGCRVGTTKRVPGILSTTENQVFGKGLGSYCQTGEESGHNPNIGRWPANLIHDGSDEVVELFPESRGQQGNVKGTENSTPAKNTYGKYERTPSLKRDDSGSAARFFYCAKSSKKDRGENNSHPTVKPTDLMRYLVRLVTPPKGIVLDPFMGSGSTGKAAKLEHFSFIGIELEQESFDTAKQRIESCVVKNTLL